MRRTIGDWLAQASAAADPAEVERCLAAATALAVSTYDWRTLLSGIAETPLASRARLVEAADKTLALAKKEREVWGFRDVATMRATRLDDVRGAREALDAGAQLFQEPDNGLLGQAAALLGQKKVTRGYEWVLLGQGYRETLNDAEGLRRCLEAGRDMARRESNADDLCSIATAWATHVDRDAGVALLVDAEALSDNGSASPWTLANAWHSLDEPDAVHRVLDAAIRRAVRCADALHVARAWASHGKPEPARAAVTRAQSLATTAAEWLAIAETALDARLGDEAVRAALEQAEASADDDQLRGRVAAAYKQWLDDEQAAARVGRRGVRPEELSVRRGGLEGWEASASGLFDWLRSRATPTCLERIAAADNGFDFEKHHAALVDICATGLVPRQLAWEPHEVLALTRWSVGQEVDHIARALSCTLLCLAPSDMDELVTTGPILVESCLALGNEACLLAERFFAWRLQTEQPSEPREGDDIGTEQPVALLLLLLLAAASRPDDPRLEALAEALLEHRRCGPDALAGWIATSMMAALWGDLIRTVLVPLRGSHRRIARLLGALAAG